MTATETRPTPTEDAAITSDRRILALLVACWIVFSLWALLQPDPPQISVVPVWVGHAVLFLGLTVAVLGLIHTRRRRWIALGIVGVAAVGSELLQELVTDQRRAELIDVGGDLAGVVIGAGLSMVLWRLARSDAGGHTRWSILAAAGLLVVSGTAIGWTSDTVRQWRECRNHTLEPVDAPLDPVLIGNERGELAADSFGLRCALLGRSGFSVAAVVVPANIDSTGPTRIITSSDGTTSGDYNLHLGQEADALSFRIRSGHQAYREWHLVPGVFEPGRRHRIVVSVDGVQAAVFVDGLAVADIQLRASSVSAWSPDYPLLVGDEVGGERRFEGTIEQVAVFDRPLSAEEAGRYGGN